MTTTDYFMATFKEEAAKGGRQSEIARITGIAKQTISGYASGKKSPGIDQQEKIAFACGYKSHLDFVQKGKMILEGDKKEAPQRVDPMSVISIVTDLVDQAQKDRDRMVFWRATFESFPCAALVIDSAGSVIYQNTASRAWGNAAGVPLCKNCINKDHCEGEENREENCAINVTIRTKVQAVRYKVLQGEVYKVEAMPLVIAAHEYILVTATVVDTEQIFKNLYPFPEQ